MEKTTRGILFDGVFRDYVKAAAGILGVDLKISDDKEEMANMLKGLSIEGVGLKRYFTIYHKMENPSEHFQYFELIYSVNRNKILANTDDNWLKNGKIIIQFGGMKPTGNKVTDNNRKQVRLYISDIYNLACDSQKAAEDLYVNIGLDYIDDDGKLDLQRPDILYLSLIKLFFYLVDGADKPLLLKIVNQLEDKLKITVKTELSGVNNVTQQKENDTNNNTEGPPKNTGIFSQLFTMVETVFESTGVELPKNRVHPSDEVIFNTVNGVFQNEATQNMVHTLIGSLKGQNDPVTAFGEVMKSVVNPAAINALQASIQQTATQAQNNMNNTNNTNNIISTNDNNNSNTIVSTNDSVNNESV